jgi:hypothetical protein
MLSSWTTCLSSSPPESSKPGRHENVTNNLDSLLTMRQWLVTPEKGTVDISWMCSRCVPWNTWVLFFFVVVVCFYIFYCFNYYSCTLTFISGNVLCSLTLKLYFRCFMFMCLWKCTVYLQFKVTLIDWLNTFIAHMSILSNAHGAWPMFWPVLRRCHILRWDWSVLPLAHHSIFHFENFGACWFLYVSTILWLTHVPVALRL